MKYAVEKLVSPAQLYGIEIEFCAHELASIVVWIGFLQWSTSTALPQKSVNPR